MSIYIIDEEEMGELSGYNTESLSYYSDGVLTDMYDNIVDDPERIIGDIRPLEHFDESDNDTIYIRNDMTRCDYEIVRDIRKFDELYSEE